MTDNNSAKKEFGKAAIIGVSGIVVGLAAAQFLPDFSLGKPYESEQGLYSYSVGYDLGRNTSAAVQVDVDQDAVIAGFIDALNGVTPELGDASIEAGLAVYSRLTLNKRQEELNELAESMLSDGDKALADLELDKEARKVEDGLYMKMLTDSDGDVIEEDDIIEMRFSVARLDGTVLTDAAEAQIFNVGQLIDAWRLPLAKTKITTGDKIEITSHSRHAFGLQGRAPDVRPNEALVFTLEPVKVITPADNENG